MKKAFTLFFLLISIIGFSQSQNVDWKTVKVYEFQSRSFPDSLEVCGGEWFVQGNGNSLNELSPGVVEEIQKKVAQHGCNVVYVDTKKYFINRHGELYILGLKQKR
ncbi:MAG: hypothetical protein ACWA41_06335 [Putridiphycobacter sp.]